MSRLRVGEWVAAAGAIGLLVVLFLHWAGGASGWSALGWFMDLLLCVAVFGGLSLSYMTVKRTSPAWPVGSGVLTTGLGTLIAIVLAVRLLSLDGDVRAAAYLGLAFAVVIPVGGFLSLRDERTDSPEARAYVPPAPRPIPDA